MSSSIFPTRSELPGIAYEVVRAVMWKGSEVIESLSGKETAIAYQANPRWEWTLRFEFLRQARGEFSSLAGFFNRMKGPFDTFLFTDEDDFEVTSQVIGSGTSVQADFQLVRTFGQFTEPVLAPNAVTGVFFDGTLIDPSNYTVSAYGSDNPGVITFSVLPGAGVSVSVNMTYYWPCRFVDQNMSFSKFMDQLYSAGSVKFKSVK